MSMERKSPEEENREYQRELDERLGPFAPRLGPHPDAIKRNMLWVWIGSMGMVVLLGRGESAQNFWMTTATLVCAAIAFGYERLYSRPVDRAYAAKRAHDARHEDPTATSSGEP
jgi:hypothetical protein